MLKLDIPNRFSKAVQFTAEINCDDNESNSVKLGLAVKCAIKTRANLSGANLSGANLSGANLARASLARANLAGADLSCASLSGANLVGTHLVEAKNSELIIAQTSILPEGELIGWKKLSNDAIAKLIIPARAKRSNATGRKCRAAYAQVDAIFDKYGKKIKTGYSRHEPSFEYKVGEIVRADNFDENRWNECASGIHFFITRIEAESYKQ